MRAFGYAAGTALIKYSYFENYTLAGPPQPSVDWLPSLNSKPDRGNSERFTGVPTNRLIMRRGRSIKFLVSHKEGLIEEEVTVRLGSCVGESLSKNIAADVKFNMTGDCSHAYPTDVCVWDGVCGVWDCVLPLLYCVLSCSVAFFSSPPPPPPSPPPPPRK